MLPLLAGNLLKRSPKRTTNGNPRRLSNTLGFPTVDKMDTPVDYFYSDRALEAKVRTMAGDFDHAGEPRAAEDAVAFTVWRAADPNGDTDVALYLRASGEVLTIIRQANQQRFADVSAAYVAVTDFSEDPDGHYNGDSNDLADILVYNPAELAAVER